MNNQSKNSGGQPGNTNACKYKTLEEAQVVLDAFIAHLEEGHSQHTFGECDARTIESTLERWNDEFRLVLQTDYREKIMRAMRRAQLIWESMPLDLANGKLKGRLNAQAWQFTMKNRFHPNWDGKWRDKQKLEESGAKEIIVNMIDYSRAEVEHG